MWTAALSVSVAAGQPWAAPGAQKMAAASSGPLDAGGPARSGPIGQDDGSSDRRVMMDTAEHPNATAYRKTAEALSLIHISEPTRPVGISRMPSSA